MESFALNTLQHVYWTGASKKNYDYSEAEFQINCAH